MTWTNGSATLVTTSASGGGSRAGGARRGGGRGPAGGGLPEGGQGAVGGRAGRQRDRAQHAVAAGHELVERGARGHVDVPDQVDQAFPGAHGAVQAGDGVDQDVAAG